MAATSSNDIQDADAHAQGLDGGLNLKSDPSRLQPPATTRADNGWYVQPGNVQQLPAFASAAPANFSHLYNVSARDTPQPATTGDVMLHGEVALAPGSSTNFFTSPVWAHNNGQKPCLEQPVPPQTIRTRALTAKLGQSFTGRSAVQALNVDAWNLLTARQEQAASSGVRRFATGHYDGSTVRLVFGICEGMQETGETLNLAASGYRWCEIIGLMGTPNFAILLIDGQGSVVRYIFDFFGNSVVGFTTIGTSVAAPSQGFGYSLPNPLHTFHHLGSTYVAYIASATNFYVYARNIATGQGYTLGTMTATTATSGAFAVCSPTAQPSSGAQSYLGVVLGGTMYVITNPFAGTQYTSAGIALPVAAVTGLGSANTSYANVTATMAGTPADTQNGLSVTQRLTFTVFRQYPEQVNAAQGQSSLAGQTRNIAYLQVASDAFSFQAQNAGPGTLTKNYGNVFRTPCGAALVAKAFAASPTESGFAGTQRANGHYCAVRAGAWQPYLQTNYAPDSTAANNYLINFVYDQPTFYLIDSQARVVGRWAEGLGVVGLDSTLVTVGNVTSSAADNTNNARFAVPLGLGTCLFTDALATANDLSCLDVSIPCWINTGLVRPANYPFSAAGQATVVTQPASAFYTPSIATFSTSAVGASPPAIQSQAYGIVSGSLTCVHDGRGVTEAGFHTAVNNLIVRPATSGTVLGVTGFYYYVAIWEWVDSQGRTHRSAPSQPAYCNANGTAFYGANVYVPCPLTTKSSFGGPIVCKVYRSTLNGATANKYYLVGSVIVNDTTSGIYTIAFSDTTFYDLSTTATGIDTSLYLTGQGVVYTSAAAISYTGLAYASNPPPSFLWQASSKGRHFGLAVVQGQSRIYYSSVLAGQYPFEWNYLNYAPVPGDIGDARSIECIDDKVLVFGSKTVGFMSGDGPAGSNAFGQPSPNDGFGLVYPVPTALGALGSGAPCRMSQGVIFQGISGMQLIGRDLTIAPVGAQVDLLTGRQIGNPGTVFARGLMVTSLQSIVWTNPAGAALVYNYLTQKWSTWPLLSGANSLVQRFDGSVTVALQPIAQGKYAGWAGASSDGADYGVLGASYAPTFQGRGGQPGLVLESPWILPSGESGGESAVFDVAITGNYVGPHVLQVEQAYNYANTYQTNVSRFTFSTAPKVYQARVRPIGGTRLWAVRYRISILPLTTLQAGYNMASLGDLVLFSGNKQGTTRLLASQSG